MKKVLSYFHLFSIYSELLGKFGFINVLILKNELIARKQIHNYLLIRYN